MNTTETQTEKKYTYPDLGPEMRALGNLAKLLSNLNQMPPETAERARQELQPLYLAERARFNERDEANADDWWGLLIALDNLLKLRSAQPQFRMEV